MSSACLRREALGDAIDDRLFFAQVREDPNVEIAALHPSDDDTVVVVSSGGCTALSLLAGGAGRVISVDQNRTQNHLVELKAAALSLGAAEATRFLGADSTTARCEAYAEINSLLGPDAREYWNGRRRAIERGVISAGVSERFIAAVVGAMHATVHSRRASLRLLQCETVQEQASLFGREWDGWRWRTLFNVLCNRLTFRSTYPAEFFAHVENPSFAEHFRRLAEHALTRLPAQNNYFLHQMLTGRYPVDQVDGVPPYLSVVGAAHVADNRARLELVDGGMTECLTRREDASVQCFALSNICEWMNAGQIDALFREVRRTAAPGARLVYRNFIGWTELPPGCDRIVVNVPLSERLTATDRSVVQRRIVACDIEAAA